MNNDDTPQVCVFCGAQVANIEAAIDAGWVPSFYFPFVENPQDSLPDQYGEMGPVCSECIGFHLDFSDDEYTIKPGHEVPTK